MDAPRALEAALAAVAAEKFVLLSGPRQVGKTTVAQRWLGAQPAGEYLSWDSPVDRKRILGNEPFASVGALVLDELHKYARWKTYLKGLYDKAHRQLQVVVTGSARPSGLPPAQVGPHLERPRLRRVRPAVLS